MEKDWVDEEREGGGWVNREGDMKGVDEKG